MMDFLARLYFPLARKQTLTFEYRLEIKRPSRGRDGYLQCADPLNFALDHIARI
jgi:hypothetical protein